VHDSGDLGCTAGVGEELDVLANDRIKKREKLMS
jgi:hypothetical protein